LLLEGVPQVDTVSNAAMALPGSPQAQSQIGDPLSKDAPTSGSPTPALGPDGRPAAPTTSASATTSATTPPTTPPAPSTTAPPPVPPSTSVKAPAPPAPQPHSGSQASQVVELVNDYRAQAGCAPVSAESHLAAAAQGHSDDMSQRGYFSHDTPEGEHFDQRIEEAGYSRPGAENIAEGSTSAAQTMQMWMNSSGHRQNILNCSLKKIGVGVATDGWYWTQDFGY
jgi:uncharacterized protein YkwD